MGIEILDAQNTSAYSITNPKVIPPSPAAQSFMRYGEIPVDYSTGVPNIDIPIYEINTGKLKLPLSLSYHASGIRVNDISDVVGLGWKLNAGGLVTRTVVGRPDDNTSGMLVQPYLTQSGINTSPGTSAYYDLKAISEGNKDSESDNYYYSVSDGLSGQFVFDSNKKLTPLTYTTNIIKYAPLYATPSTEKVNITKDDGTQYFFEKTEQTLFDAQWYPSTFWLTKIVNADKTDSITFEYTTTPSAYFTPYYSDEIKYNALGIAQNSGVLTHINITQAYQTLLTKINFRNGNVQFAYAKDRKDMVREYRLSTISIYNQSNSLLSKYELLNNSYFYSGIKDDMYNYRLKLSGLNTYDGNNSYINQYDFGYNESHILPPYINYDSKDNSSFGIDFWGYYNGVTTNTFLLPYAKDITGANRNPNINYTRSCTLNKITYPTGGYDTFEYESNIKADNSLTGGIRIKKIATYNNSTDSIIKRYTYSKNLIGEYNELDAEGIYSYIQNFNVVNGCFGTPQDYTIFMDNPIVPYSNFHGNSALYESVDEVVDGGSNSLKTTYWYAAESNPVYSVNSPRYLDQYFLDRSWRRGQLDEIDYFKWKNGTYHQVKSISNYYSDYKTQTIIAGTKVQQKTVIDKVNENCPSGFYVFNDIPCPPTGFYYFDVLIEVGIKKLTKQFTTEYDDNGNRVSKEENFKYESPYHLNTTTSDITDSKGSKIITQYKYPHDFAGIGVYDAMISSNRISPVIERSEYKENTNNFLQSIKTNYDYFQNNKIIAPSSIDVKTGSNNYETRLVYGAYDSKGNPQYICKDDATKEVYLWSYNKQYPVAKIEGLTYAQVVAQYPQTSIDNLANTANPTVDQLNTIRTALASQLALVTTYTYSPLIGIVTATDPRGVTTNYTYDAFSRLIYIKNHDNKILNEYRYHYSNQ